MLLGYCEGLGPVMPRAQSLQPFPDAGVIVPRDALVESLLELFDGVEPVVVEELFLEVAEETFHRCVVVAVGRAGHGLVKPAVRQGADPGPVLVLPALVRVQDRMLTGVSEP